MRFKGCNWIIVLSNKDLKQSVDVKTSSSNQYNINDPSSSTGCVILDYVFN